MLSGFLEHVLPASQRRTPDELAQDLDLSVGDSRAKRSAFCTMLTLSSVIAAGGVLTDSTATVIGAMIIAPLSTPIMGIALDIVRQNRTGAVRTVVLGCLLVVGVGLLFSLVVPGGYDLLQNTQISGRTSPGIMALVAALATGAAGAVGLARRDVAAVLPGVAIAISLVPPLVVAGVCLGKADLWQAAGALVLFLSNLLALVFAGMVVFAASGYGKPREHRNRQAARRAYLALGLLFAAVFVPLAANTAATVLIFLLGTFIAVRRRSPLRVQLAVLQRAVERRDEAERRVDASRSAHRAAEESRRRAPAPSTNPLSPEPTERRGGDHIGPTTSKLE